MTGSGKAIRSGTHKAPISPLKRTLAIKYPPTPIPLSQPSNVGSLQAIPNSEIPLNSESPQAIHSSESRLTARLYRSPQRSRTCLTSVRQLSDQVQAGRQRQCQTC